MTFIRFPGEKLWLKVFGWAHSDPIVVCWILFCSVYIFHLMCFHFVSDFFFWQSTTLFRLGTTFHQINHGNAWHLNGKVPLNKYLIAFKHGFYAFFTALNNLLRGKTNVIFVSLKHPTTSDSIVARQIKRYLGCCCCFVVFFWFCFVCLVSIVHHFSYHAMPCQLHVNGFFFLSHGLLR